LGSGDLLVDTGQAVQEGRQGQLEACLVDLRGVFGKPVGLGQVGVAVTVDADVVVETAGEGLGGRAHDQVLGGGADHRGVAEWTARTYQPPVHGVGAAQRLLPTSRARGHHGKQVGVCGEGVTVGACPAGQPFTPAHVETGHVDVGGGLVGDLGEQLFLGPVVAVQG